MEKTFNVNDYRRKGISDDEAIADCMRDAALADSRTLVFSGADWLISRAILLSSNTTVIIDNCRIKQADETFDNMFRGDNLEIDPNDPNSAVLSCAPIHDVTILGKGNAILEGPDKNRVSVHPVTNEFQEMTGDFWGWRTLQISLSRCTDFEIGNLTFLKTRCWALSFDICQYGYVHNLVFDTRVKNGDGVDFRSGCHHCKVENITGITWDDTVACTALWYPGKGSFYPDGNAVYPMEPTVRLGNRSDEERDISDIEIRNVKTGGKHHGVIVLAANGCKNRRILIEDVQDVGGEEREATVKIYTGYGSGYTPGDISDIKVRRVTGFKAVQTLYCNTRVNNVELVDIFHENKTKKAIKLEFPEGVTYSYTQEQEIEERYSLGVYAFPNK